jgi:peroxiredoxin family protein
MEKRIVNEEFVAQSDNYNLRVGGYGGFDYVNSEKCNNPTHSSSHLLRMTQLARTPEAIVKHRNALTSIDKVAASKKRSATLLERYGNDTSMFSTFNGRTHTKESKLKMSKSKQGLLVGEKNGQYGTMWIKNPQSKECSKIQKQDFSTWHQQGWVKGKYQNGAVYVRLIN